MSKHADSIERFVAAYMEVLGVTYDPNMRKIDRVNLNGDVKAKLDGAYDFAYRAKYKDDAWRVPVQTILALNHVSKPQSLVTNGMHELEYLFGPDVFTASQTTIKMIGSKQDDLDQFFEANPDNAPVSLPTDMGLALVADNSVDVCLDVRTALEMKVKELEIGQFSRILKPKGLALVTVPKITNHNATTKKARTVIGQMRDHGLYADETTVAFLPSDILVYGIK